MIKIKRNGGALTFVVGLPVLGIIDLDPADHAVLAVLVREHDAQSERGVGNVVVEIVLKKIFWLTMSKLL